MGGASGAGEIDVKAIAEKTPGTSTCKGASGADEINVKAISGSLQAHPPAGGASSAGAGGTKVK